MAMTLNTVNTCAHMGIYCIICVERKVAKNTWRKYLPIENCENSRYSAWDLSATRREQSWTIMIIWLRRHLLPEQWPRAESVNSYARQSPARVRVLFLYCRERRGTVCLWLLRYPQTGAGNCQAPARGRATISLTIGNGHQWQLRANNGFDLNLNTTLSIVKEPDKGVATLCSCI